MAGFIGIGQRSAWAGVGGLALLILAWAGARAAAAKPAAATPRFTLPAACEIGRDCFIQNYVDHDPGPGRLDFACGRLSYEGHKGTDVRLPDYRAMERGVAVLAAADGVVRAVRDGMEDVNIRTTGPEAVKNREAGNSVVLMHGNGWETQYGHMKRGSVAVKPGDRVRAGQPLGEIGLSGFTEFPHVHFEVRHEGRAVDPFTGKGMDAAGAPACPPGGRPATVAAGAAPPEDGTMWVRPEDLRYIETALLSVGLAVERPEPEQARRGAYDMEALPADAPLLVVWTDVMGALAGDRRRVRILDEAGRALFDHEETQKDSKVSQFAFAGLRRPKEGWPSTGSLRAVVTLTRDGRPFAEMERRLPVR
ncbi:M23 family metallopeptidase [Azospirillum sp. SYSU D00513]|uniref:M23 family metallopeptidase n=1 Tax=Azospirillum sp. SYSU D00513 TaxID=2812561 RepID=UPI001A9637ED|nr:M23 family metallopeptidase [Azospirillum sp. SYSU D00513]